MKILFFKQLSFIQADYMETSKVTVSDLHFFNESFAAGYLCRNLAMCSEPAQGDTDVPKQSGWIAEFCGLV